jgi:hypothetical protein
MLRSMKVHQLALGMMSFCTTRIADVRAVESWTVNTRASLGQLQALEDLARRAFVGGRGERDARHLAGQRVVPTRRAGGTPAGSHGPTATRNALRRWRTAQDPLRSSRLETARRQQAFGRHVEQVELTAPKRASTRMRRLARSRQWSSGTRRARRARQRVDLILHQRDQRRDDQADAGRSRAGIW